MARRDFGRVRQPPSGRWQVRYPGPDGVLRPAPRTFDRKREATDWLAEIRTEMARGDWIDPDRGRVSFAEFGGRWLEERELSETTRQRYGYAFRLHLVPTFGDKAVAEIREPHVRTRRADRLNEQITNHRSGRLAEGHDGCDPDEKGHAGGTNTSTAS